MIFSEFYKGPRSPLTKLRHHQHDQLTTAAPDWVKEEYADLLSRDKLKQKEAVKRYLTSKVRNDWLFTWPPAPVQESLVEHSDHNDAQVTVKPSEATKTENNVPPTPSTDAPAEVQTIPTAHPIQDDEVRDDDGYHVDDDADGLSDDESETENNADAVSIYSIVSEDPQHYQALTEWISDLSDDEGATSSPFRFDNPDAVGSAIKASVAARQARQRKELRSEMAWNDGLACFQARRTAWTGARVVRVRAKPSSPTSPSGRSPKRFFFRRSSSTSPAVSTTTTVRTSTTSQPHSHEGSAVLSDDSSVAKESEKALSKQPTAETGPSTPPSTADDYPVQTLIPLAPPLLPPNNPLRASITPSVYLNLYDKVVLHSLQPTCPINLSDMLRSCVAGWKRDGEWPPQPTAAEPSMAARRKKAANDNNGNVARRMSNVFLGRDKADDGKSGNRIRRSIQRALGIGSPTSGQ
ncbi:hypothetical protein S40293_03029 [Stachybotrys chartarum IBT 40293]|nr:hypothetical protein S40293_03029 [Stachybotrys chartarum IBT 40293]